MEIIITIIIAIFFAIFTGFSVYFFKIQKDNEERNKSIEIELENKYLKGKEDGMKEAIKRIGIKYEGYIEESNMFFVKTIETGYYSQLLLDGIPIGERSKNTISIIKESKDQNIKNIIKGVNDTINNAINAISQFGINAITGSEIKKIIKK